MWIFLSGMVVGAVGLLVVLLWLAERAALDR